MQIDWSESIAGVPMLKVRDFLLPIYKWEGASEFGLNQQLEKLDPAVDRTAFTKALISRGWLERRERELFRGGVEVSYVLTPEGNAVAQAKKVRPLSREKATDLLDKVRRAADEINSDENYAHDVTGLAVFGSYLGDAQELGDLDIGYELTARWNSDTAEAVWKRFWDTFPPPSQDTVRKVFWLEAVPVKKLHVSNRVSLHQLSEIKDGGFPHQMLIG